MPAQTVVVKRARRRAFAILRTAPAWLRATLATGLAGLRGAEHDRPASPAPPASHDGAVRSSNGEARGIGIESGSGFPFLRSELGPAAFLDAPGCAECRRCLAACPSQCLFLELDQGSRDSGLSLRFEIEPGSCIGCGECVEVCPADLLVLGPDPNRVGLGAGPARRSLALGRDPALTQDVGIGLA
jgi:ferredoxin